MKKNIGNTASYRKMREFVALVVIILISLNSSGQNVQSLDSLQRYNFNKSDIVVLGEVIELDTNSLICSVRVYEVFKGQSLSVINFKITTGYTYLPNKSGLWIFYANRVSENTYVLYDNGLSRSNVNPEKIFYYELKPLKGPKGLPKHDCQTLETKIRALTDWNNELYKLRQIMIDH